MRQTDIKEKAILDKIIDKIYELPMVDKYYDEYIPAQVWACVEPYELRINLYNARKNYFRKTIEQIKAITGVKDAWYSKAQDETVSDRIIVVFNEIKGTQC